MFVIDFLTLTLLAPYQFVCVQYCFVCAHCTSVLQYYHDNHQGPHLHHNPQHSPFFTLHPLPVLLCTVRLYSTASQREYHDIWLLPGPYFLLLLVLPYYFCSAVLQSVCTILEYCPSCSSCLYSVCTTIFGLYINQPYLTLPCILTIPR